MLLKKYISFCIALLLLINSSDVKLNAHYCQNKIASISFETFTAKKCVNKKTIAKSCCKKAVKNKKCCSNKKIQLKKLVTDNLLVEKASIKLSSFILSNKSLLFIAKKCLKITTTSQQKIYFYCNSNSPPIYKLTSRYIFYA